MEANKSKESEAKEYWEQSVQLAFKHDQTNALEYINKALALIPSSEKYAIEKAEILCEQGKCQEAQKFLLKYSHHDLVKKELEKINEAIKFDQAKPQENLINLLKWGKENGIDTKNIKVVYYGPDFRGVHAARRIRTGERIITVPMKSLLTLEIILDCCNLAKKVSESGVDLEYPFPTALACLIHETKGKTGQYWQPYVNSFPESADNFPYFFSEEEKKYLKGTIFENKTKEEMKQ